MKINSKTIIMSAVGLIAIISLFIMITNYNYYGRILKIEISRRDADFREDTHGGFNGDGDTVEIYELTDKEIEKLNKDITGDGVWKLIDDEARDFLYYDAAFSDGYFLNKVPKVESGWYCFYDKQTDTYAFPDGTQHSYNYIIGQYSEGERKLWIYELDT